LEDEAQVAPVSDPSNKLGKQRAVVAPATSMEASLSSTEPYPDLKGEIQATPICDAAHTLGKERAAVALGICSSAPRTRKQKRIGDGKPIAFPPTGADAAAIGVVNLTASSVGVAAIVNATPAPSVDDAEAVEEQRLAIKEDGTEAGIGASSRKKRCARLAEQRAPQTAVTSGSESASEPKHEPAGAWDSEPAPPIGVEIGDAEGEPRLSSGSASPVRSAENNLL